MGRHIGIMEKKMETTGIIGLYRDNSSGFRVKGLAFGDLWLRNERFRDFGLFFAVYRDNQLSRPFVTGQEPFVAPTWGSMLVGLRFTHGCCRKP